MAGEHVLILREAGGWILVEDGEGARDKLQLVPFEDFTEKFIDILKSRLNAHPKVALILKDIP